MMYQGLARRRLIAAWRHTSVRRQCRRRRTGRPAGLWWRPPSGGSSRARLEPASRPARACARPARRPPTHLRQNPHRRATCLESAVKMKSIQWAVKTFNESPPEWICSTDTKACMRRMRRRMPTSVHRYSRVRARTLPAEAPAPAHAHARARGQESGPREARGSKCETGACDHTGNDGGLQHRYMDFKTSRCRERVARAEQRDTPRTLPHKRAHANTDKAARKRSPYGYPCTCQ
eukprot:6192596-Pleurochrysis_carterae.AAC.4